jgi:tetratricopeptide (TPR) repeat protein
MTIRTGLRRFSAVATEIPRIHYREGLESGFMDDYESAIESFDRVNYITIGSSYWTKQSQFYKAQAYCELEQYDKAVEEYKKFLEYEKKDPSGWNNLGAAYIELEKYEDALPCFEKAIELESKQKDPDEELLESAWANKGTIFLAQDDERLVEDGEDYLDLVEQCVNEILKLNPESQEGLSLKTALLWMQEKNDEAIENDKKCCKLDPDSWENWNSLATAYSTVNNVDEALKYYQKAIEIKPNEDLPWYNKACMLSKMNKMDDALDALLVAISIAPENLSGLSDEEDFDNIKNSERFKKFLKIPI